MHSIQLITHCRALEMIRNRLFEKKVRNAWSRTTSCVYTSCESVAGEQLTVRRLPWLVGMIRASRPRSTTNRFRALHLAQRVNTEPKRASDWSGKQNVSMWGSPNGIRRSLCVGTTVGGCLISNTY